MVLVGAGGVEHDQLVSLAEKHFGGLKSSGSAGKKPFAKAGFTGSECLMRYDEYQTAHVAIAVEGVSHTNPDFWPLLVLQSIVGTWDRSLGAAGNVSSKLAQQLGKHNLANSFMSFNTSYSDTGLFGIYFTSDAKLHLDDACHWIVQEWMRLCTSVSEAEVFRAKNQLKTSMLLSLDGTTPIAEDIGRQILNYGKRLNPWEMDALIEQVTVSDVMRVAQKYIYDNDLAIVGYGPCESIQDYNRMRANMTKLAVGFQMRIGLILFSLKTDSFLSRFSSTKRFETCGGVYGWVFEEYKAKNLDFTHSKTGNYLSQFSLYFSVNLPLTDKVHQRRLVLSNHTALVSFLGVKPLESTSFTDPNFFAACVQETLVVRDDEDAALEVFDGADESVDRVNYEQEDEMIRNMDFNASPLNRLTHHQDGWSVHRE